MNDLTIYSNEELKKIQEIELKCLKEIIHICEEENIEYFLIGGSTLGAVRHKGFIPWDDDIDIGMTRDNYEKFLKVAPNKLSEIYYLQTPYGKEKNNPYFYSKVRINGTQFVEYCNRKVNMHHGCYVDVFPFDEVPDNEEDNINQFNDIQKLIRKFNLKQTPDISAEPKKMRDCIKSLIRRIIHFLFKFISYDKLVDDLQNTFTKYNGTNQEAYACLNFPERKKEYVKKEDLYPLLECEFEGIRIKIPHNYDTYLKTHYGNYMELPPKEMQYGHKPFYVDLGK